MYNNEFNYYIKKLLGRKNDAWYFDNLEKSFKKTHRRNSIDLIKWSDNAAEKNEIGFINNPLYDLANTLREELFNSHRNLYKEENLKIAIHLPPEHLSAGGNSWLRNFGTALTFMGIDVFYFWENIDIEKLRSANILLGIGSSHITKHLDWDIINEVQKSGKLKVFLQASIDVLNEEAIDIYLEAYLKYRVDGFYSFHAYSFLETSALYSRIKTHGLHLFSIQFSANPISHFPSKYIKQDFDFIFLGSSNYDKALRYSQYFLEPFKKLNGIVAGPGWGWFKNFNIIPERDKYLYSRAKVALNLHIPSQIECASELNERAYILAAVGITQITDRPALLEKNYNKIGFVANTPEEYYQQILFALENPKICFEISKNAMEETYNNHTTFHRVIDFIEAFKSCYLV